MKIVVKDLSEVQNYQQAPAVRFSVTLAEDNGEALMTVQGFLMDAKRTIRPPQTRTKFGGFYAFTMLTTKFAARLREILESIPAVQGFLGDPPPENTKPIPGEFDV